MHRTRGPQNCGAMLVLGLVGSVNAMIADARATG
jgi:hypothetical protein